MSSHDRSEPYQQTPRHEVEQGRDNSYAANLGNTSWSRTGRDNSYPTGLGNTSWRNVWLRQLVPKVFQYNAARATGPMRTETRQHVRCRTEHQGERWVVLLNAADSLVCSNQATHVLSYLAVSCHCRHASIPLVTWQTDPIPRQRAWIGWVWYLWYKEKVPPKWAPVMSRFRVSENDTYWKRHLTVDTHDGWFSNPM